VVISIPSRCPRVKLVALLHAALPQVRGHTNGSFISPSATFFAFIIGVLLIGLVVAPAVWSRRPARRKAAAGVLDLLLRFLRPGSR